MRIDVRARPGTALTSETVLLIDLKPIANATRETTLAKCEFQTFRDRPHPRRHPIRLAQFCRANRFRRLRTRDWILISLHFLFLESCPPESDDATFLDLEIQAQNTSKALTHAVRVRLEA